MKTIGSVDRLKEALVDSEKHAHVIEAPLSLWLAALRDAPEMAFAMADRPEAPEEVIIALAVFGDDQTRTRIAMRNKLNPEVLALLSTDPNEATAGNVVYKDNVTREILESFLVHPWEKLREVAERRLSELDHNTTSES